MLLDQRSLWGYETAGLRERRGIYYGKQTALYIKVPLKSMDGPHGCSFGYIRS